MKKLVAMSIIVSVLGVYSMSHAAKVNNGAGVQGAPGKIAFGLEYDSISDRDMAFDSGFIAEGGAIEPFLAPGNSITGSGFESTRVLLKGSIGIAPWIDLFIKLGFADAELTYQLNEAVGPPETIKFDGDTDLAYGFGAKAVIGTIKGYQVYSDLQLLLSEVDGAYSENGIVEPGAAEAKIQEIQLAFFVARTLGMWTPYGGLKFSESKVEIDRSIPVPGGTENPHEEHKIDSNVGIFVGTDVVLVPGISANIEARFIDESALSLGLNWAF